MSFASFELRAARGGLLGCGGGRATGLAHSYLTSTVGAQRTNAGQVVG